MAFFTGKGDTGTTKLFDSLKGQRVSKASPIFETLGMLDELNTLVGWCRVIASRKKEIVGDSMHDILLDVQDHLFTLQAEVAGAPKSIAQTSVDALNTLVGEIEKALPEIKTFLVPGGTELSARLDVARAVSRRVERRLVQLHESGERTVSDASRAYANRLSSILYALVRFENHSAGVPERPPQYQ